MKNTQAVATRLAGLALCIAAVAAAYGAWQTHRAEKLELQLQHSYLRAVQDASDSVTALSIALQKGVYAGTPGQLSQLSARLWRDAGAAKSALATLPAQPLELEKTYHFLSQVGDYAHLLSRKAAAGEEISPEERETFASLRSYAQGFSQQLAQLESSLAGGSLSVEALLSPNQENPAPAEEPTGLRALEAGLESYAGLLYDGPFSDHMGNRSPQGTAGLATVPREAARQVAAKISGRLPGQLQQGCDENSQLPLFCFEAEGMSAAVSKRGGLPVWYSDSRPVGSPLLTEEECITMAATYLQKIGYPSMAENDYETMGGVMTINFAYRMGEITCYTDLIKVGVAMDSGQIVLLDARGYLFHHADREPMAPTLSLEEAQTVLSPALSPQRGRLALIPTPGQYERLCYEFLCQGYDGQQVLVYVNADTGAEEQILLVQQNQNGVLTM